MAGKKEKKESKALVNMKGLLSKVPKGKDKGSGTANMMPPTNKKGISFQIQTRIGKSVAFVLIVIAVLATVMVNKIVTEANDNELKLESQVASHQIAEFLAPFETMTEQLAVNTELQLLMKTLSVAKNTAKHSGYPDALANMQHIQSLDSENINAVWFADVDANMIATSLGYISDETWEITTRPWYGCIEKAETVYTVPFLETTTGKTIVTIATPVIDTSGKVIGVTGMDIAVDVIMNTLAEFIIGDNGYVMLIAEDGTFVYHPDSNIIGTNINDMNISDNLTNAI